MKSILSSAILFVLFSSVVSAGVLFSDDFSNGLSQWNTYSGDSGYSIGTTSSDGLPPPCALIDDYASNGANIRSKATFSYVGKNLEFIADLKQGNGGWAQSHAVMQVSKPSDTWYGLALMVIAGSNNDTWSHTAHILVDYLDENQQSQFEDVLLPLPSGMTGDGWHTGKIEIRADGKVDFYLKDNLTDYQLLYSSTHLINPTFDGSASFQLGSRRSYYDNALVQEVPEPASLSLLVLGGLALLRRRKA
jgi:hypothetical protein